MILVKTRLYAAPLIQVIKTIDRHYCPLAGGGLILGQLEMGSKRKAEYARADEK